MPALQGLLIVEIAEGVAGPACGLQCADLGARVIKVEPPWGDRSREWGPSLDGGDSAVFEQLNAGKESVVLDLRQQDGRERLERLLEHADALIVEDDPAECCAIGLDWAAMAGRHPDLVVCEIDAFGGHGPLAGRAGSELVVQAMSGFTRYIGEPGGEPCRVGFEIAGMATAMHAFQAVAAALLRRGRCGNGGQHVRVSALGSLLSMKSILLAAQSGDTDDWTGFHLNGPHWPPDTGWDTSDGQITFDFRHGQRDGWVRFCQSIGLPGLPDDPEYEDWRSTIYIGDRRFSHGAPYRERFARMTSEAACAAINTQGGISVKFHDYGEMLVHPQVRHIGPLVDAPGAPLGARRQVGQPFRFEGEPRLAVRTPAPRLSQHSNQMPERNRRGRQPAPSPGNEATGTGPLAGLKVLDASMGAVGPWAGALLGQLGADVVKLESPQGDFIRNITPRKGGLSTTYIACNFNKRGVVLDLKKPGERREVHQLAARADVFIENFRPGVAARIGVGWEELSALNPRLVYASASGYGPSGPMVELGATDPHLQPFTGSCSVNGARDGKRQRWRWYGHFDCNTALCIVEGVLAALLGRERTGRGTLVQVTMVEAAAAMQRVRIAEHLAGQEPRPMGSATTYLAPDQAFPAKDRPVAVTAGSDREWNSLCGAIGRPDLAGNPRFARNPDRIRNRGALIAILEPIFAARPAVYWLDVLARAHVSCALFTSYDEFRHNAHYLTNRMIQSFDTPHWGRIDAAGVPWRFAKTPGTLWPGEPPGTSTAAFRDGRWPAPAPGSAG